MLLKRASIKAKIIALVVTLVVVCSGMPIFLVYQAFVAQLASNKALEFDGETTLQGLLFTTRIQEMISDVNLIAGGPAAEAITNEVNDPAGRERGLAMMARGFNQLLLEKPYYVQARFIAVGGQEMLRVDRYGEGGSLQRVPDDQLQDKSQRAYVVESFADESAPYYISGINLNREYGVIVKPYEPVVRVTKLIFDEAGLVLGMVVINQRINDLFAEMERTANPLHTYLIIDQEGNYLKHIDSRKEFAFEFSEHQSAFQDFEGIEGMFAKAENEQYFSVIDGPNFRGAIGVRSVSYDPRSPEHKIGIILLGSKADIDALANTTLSGVLLIIFGLLGLAMMISIGIAHSIARPLRDMAGAISLDNFDATLAALPIYTEKRCLLAKALCRSKAAVSDVRPRAHRNEVVALAWALRHYLGEIKAKTQALQLEVNEHNRAERDLRTANLQLSRANGELEQFAYIASHDLRAPLRVIDNAASWLEEDLSSQLSGDQLENLLMLRQRTRRLEQLLEDLADYTMVGKQTDRRYETRVSGTQMIDRVRFLLKPPESCKLIFNGQWDKYEFISMPLQHVLSNLINNAIKHGAKTGAEIIVSVRTVGDSFGFDMEDKCPGIDEEYRDLIFVMFKTLKPRDEVEGSGMGLAIVRKILDLYGGDISVSESKSGGCVFTVVWPQQALNKEA
jgi:signal transduction histidine kinase